MRAAAIYQKVGTDLAALVTKMAQDKFECDVLFHLKNPSAMYSTYTCLRPDCVFKHLCICETVADMRVRRTYGMCICLRTQRVMSKIHSVFYFKRALSAVAWWRDFSGKISRCSMDFQRCLQVDKRFENLHASMNFMREFYKAILRTKNIQTWVELAEDCKLMPPSRHKQKSPARVLQVLQRGQFLKFVLGLLLGKCEIACQPWRGPKPRNKSYRTSIDTLQADRSIQLYLKWMTALLQARIALEKVQCQSRLVLFLDYVLHV